MAVPAPTRTSTAAMRIARRAPRRRSSLIVPCRLLAARRAEVGPVDQPNAALADHVVAPAPALAPVRVVDGLKGVHADRCPVAGDARRRERTARALDPLVLVVLDPVGLVTGLAVLLVL